MELIPILSTIILVATISTFILAIGAYILYKVRERKRENYKEEHTKEVEAEVISPAYPPDEKTEVNSIKKESIDVAGERSGTVLQDNIDEKKYSKPDKIFNEKINNEEDIKDKKIKHWKSRIFKDSKFLKYTSEGYVAAKSVKDSGAKKWR